jgi:hypothetical protein
VSTEEFSEVILSAVKGKVADVKFTTQWVVLFAPSRFRRGAMIGRGLLGTSEPESAPAILMSPGPL